MPSRSSARRLAGLCLLALFLPAVASARTLKEIRYDALVVMDAYTTTFFLDGKNRTGHDPYAWSFTGEDKIQTESTAMALYYAGIDNLELDPTTLQEIYDFFSYMDAGDGWLYSDYTVANGRVYKKFLHNAWTLAGLMELEAAGIPDSDGLIPMVRDALESAIDVNGFMDAPDDNDSLRTKSVQSLPFLFEVALDTSDTGAIAASRRAVDFYMVNCIDGNFDLWKINASGSKLSKLNAHESQEFTHGLVLFHELETDPTRLSTLQTNITGLLNRYRGAPWSYDNSFGERYISNAASAGTVNTLAQFQIQYSLTWAGRKGWMPSGLSAAYRDIADRIRITGTGIDENDNNFYYWVNPDTAAVISGNLNSYSPGYVVYAIDTDSNEVAGRIVDQVGQPLEGVSVTADNGGGSATGDHDGEYLLLVPHDWTGVVTPTFSGVTFEPASQGYANVVVNLANQDYAEASPVIETPGLQGFGVMALALALGLTSLRRLAMPGAAYAERGER